MKYTLAFAAAVAGALATPSMVPVAYGQEGSTSTAYVTDEVTVFSCGPEVTSCPYRSSTVPPSSAPATSTPVATTSSAPAPPVYTAPSSSSKPVTSAPATTAPATSAPATSAPATTAPVSTSTPAPAPPAPSTPAASSSVAVPPVISLSTQAISTCVPTTIYATITVTHTPTAVTTPVAITAPYGTAPASSGIASGTGVVPKPSSTAPIVSANGASNLQMSFGGVALAAAAAVLFA